MGPTGRERVYGGGEKLAADGLVHQVHALLELGPQHVADLFVAVVNHAVRAQPREHLRLGFPAARRHHRALRLAHFAHVIIVRQSTFNR
jgi:hypothetical protein